MPKYSAASLFFALGDPTRLRVVSRLCEKPASVSELAAPFRMALPSFLQHLKVLEDSRWISSSKVGRVRICRINPAALTQVSGWLEYQRESWEKRLDRMDEYLLKLKSEEENAES